MSWLLEVNFILASRWTTHADHPAVSAWLDSVDRFHTCAITKLGFVRISMNPVYGASWEEVQESLKKLHEREAYRFVSDDVDAAQSPKTEWRDTTDAHLVVLASRHGLNLATLDANLIEQPWAREVAINPLTS